LIGEEERCWIEDADMQGSNEVCGTKAMKTTTILEEMQKIQKVQPIIKRETLKGPIWAQ
jgi:hypothetical protein